MTNAQLKKTPAYTTSPTGAPVKQAQVTYLDKTFVWKCDNLSYTYDPLSLIFVAKQSETANVEDILQEETAEGVIVPAVLLMYNSDKVMQQNIEQGVYITLDAATILLSGEHWLMWKLPEKSFPKPVKLCCFLKWQTEL